MTRGDFANLPAGTPHGWTMRSDRAQIALFTMNDRVGAAFVAMGAPQANTTVPASGDLAIPAGNVPAIVQSRYLVAGLVDFVSSASKAGIASSTVPSSMTGSGRRSVHCAPGG